MNMRSGKRGMRSARPGAFKKVRELDEGARGERQSERENQPFDEQQRRERERRGHGIDAVRDARARAWSCRRSRRR